MSLTQRRSFWGLFLRRYLGSAVAYVAVRVPNRVARLLGLDRPAHSLGRKIAAAVLMPLAAILAVLVFGLRFALRMARRGVGFAVRVARVPARVHRGIAAVAIRRVCEDILAEVPGPRRDRDVEYLARQRWLDATGLGQLIKASAKEKNDRLTHRLADIVVRRFEDDLPSLRQAGVEAFLGGNYPVAERLWSAWEAGRERARDSGLWSAEAPRLLGHTWLIAIGHIAHLDTYFKWQRLTGREGAVAFNVPPGFKIPNEDLLDRWRGYLGERLVECPPPEDAQALDSAQDEFWGLPVPDGQFRMFSYAGAWVQSEWQRRALPPLLSLSEEDHERAATSLRRLGVPKGRWFVCLHVREPGFHEAWHKTHPATRNADVDTYVEAAKAIVAKGGFVIRMGDPSMKKLRPVLGVIDYAHSAEKSEFLDIYLSAACRFFIGTNSGLGLVPPVFGVPCALTNWSPIGLPQWYPGDLYIPKLCRSEPLGRYLTLEEMFGSRAGWGQFADDFDRDGLFLEDNSPEDIRDLVLDMLERGTGAARFDATDATLRAECERLALAAGSYVGAPLGARFLRRYSSLLLPGTGAGAHAA